MRNIVTSIHEVQVLIVNLKTMKIGTFHGIGAGVMVKHLWDSLVESELKSISQGRMVGPGQPHCFVP